MRHTTPITIEHIVVESNQPYEKVVGALEARLGPAQDWAAIWQQAAAAHASWEQFTQAVEAHIGASGLTLFFQVEHSFLLSLIGKTSRATQYTIGNPLLATQMTRHMPEAGLYAPLKLVIYEDEERRTFVAYDGFVSLLAQYQREEITQVAKVVEQKLEALIDDQIVPIADSALLSAKLVKDATLKVYPGAPHGLMSTHKQQFNEDLLAFLRS